jgi:formyl-CoA transferase
MPGPLSGVKVFEVSQIIAGPVCGQNLADLGADVIKVEPPAGEGARLLGAFMPGESKAFHVFNRGKRSLVIDLQHEQGQQLVQQIIPNFDVFIINARPGVPARLGVDYETLSAIRPDLIYMENTGYGTVGPNKDRSGSDIVAQAYSGLMAGDGKVNEDGAPELITATAPADYMSAMAGAMGICAALFQRNNTGQGQYVSTTLLASALTLQSAVVSRLPVVDAVVRAPMEQAIADGRANGTHYSEMLANRGDTYRLLGAAFRLYYGGYQAKDGAIILGALTPANREQMRQVIGIEDDPTAVPDFNALDPANDPVVAEVRARIREAMVQKTTAEWMEAFDTVGAPAAPVQFPEELSDDPQVQALNLMRSFEHELVGAEELVGPIIDMPGADIGSPLPPPPLDRHTDEVLAECGVAADAVASLRAAGAIGVPAA